ncbi:enoyl-CoA hydratase/isomerase family protein [Chelatococcus asaccharovorans]|uniref:enoyl-CoA hydratase/isomerase family protein n=1 Tax=Chelatococcus asaccharovorans TaxID=28210 RepID=UPI00224C7007|nr:enoyl-CoA hydratase/isomerase family protein [Chelatococcus asaccharovorans]CAH1650257.1 Enoyl-CoA hydratase/enoyl-CoA hydratase [Chelatococcus asaccharovorans]CAH1692151.1 Enoyl-CoA hydratase/enoyl-CoA hydratase [Chelatococcus asaccharovorans]
MSDTRPIYYERKDGIGYVVLNRPDKLNAISEPMKAMLVEAFAEADRDRETCVTVLRGEGRSFCAGHDISGDDEDNHEENAINWHEHLAGSVRSEMAPFEAAKPVIASVQGHALGGGCQLAMFCDLVIAADTAKFGEPEVRLGYAGPAFIMPWIAGFRRAREFIYFGDHITAEVAHAYGIVNKVVPADTLSAATHAYAKRLSLVGPEVLMRTKLALKRGLEAAGFRNAINAGHDIVAALYATETQVGREFNSMVERDGFKAALGWRSNQFKT